MPEMICHCGATYIARQADLKRGWGYSCSKSCASKRKDKSLPRAVRSDGKKTKKSRPKPSGWRPNDCRNVPNWSNPHEIPDPFENDHPFSEEALGQWK